VRIGVLAPPWIPIPPDRYGGIESVVALLARGLADAGHDVTLVAAPGSRVQGVRTMAPLARLPAQIGLARDEWLHTLRGTAELGDAEVVIDHSGPLGALLVASAGRTVLHVMHGPLGPHEVEVYEAVAARAANLRLVAISHSQQAPAPHLPYAGVCHNGLDLEDVPFRDDKEEYLAFLGRMSPEKGAAEAIAIARAAGLPLHIGAKCREPAEQEYFAREVEPHLGPDARWLGELNPHEKYALLAGARALVFPISWSEPFGLVAIEAMACGTPVLATRFGAVPEVVDEGRTGFVRAQPEELARAADRLDEIDPAECRLHVARRFSAQAMVGRYERLAVAEVQARMREDRLAA